MKLFGITLKNSEPSRIVKNLCAALRIRKRVAWLEWLISEVFREVEVIEITSIHRRPGEVVIFLIMSQGIQISIHIQSDRRLHIQRYYSADGGNRFGYKIIGSCKLYQNEPIFPKSLRQR